MFRMEVFSNSQNIFKNYTFLLFALGASGFHASNNVWIINNEWMNNVEEILAAKGLTTIKRRTKMFWEFVQSLSSI